MYGYCLGDPINFCDPDGEIAGAIIGFAVGGVTGAAWEGFQAYRSGVRGDALWRAVGRGALTGGVYGAAMGAFGPAGGIAAAAAMGAIGGAAANVAGQAYDNVTGGPSGFSTKSLVRDTIISGATAGALHWAGGMLSKWLCEGFKGGCFDGDTLVTVPVQTPVQAAPQSFQVAMATNSATKGKAPNKSLKSVKLLPAPKAIATTTKRIRDLHERELVATRNPETGKIEFKPIVKTFVRTSDHLISVALADKTSGKVVQTLQTTRQHPFNVEGKGWVPAGGLAVGNAIVTRAGPPLIVQSIQWHRRAEGYTVYNLEVADNHSYFVGTANGGVWVHNGACADGDLFDESELGELSTPQKRGDLRARMGPAPFEEAEAHHELPWEFRDWFAKRGFNVNNPKFGRWVPNPIHKSWTAAYQTEWENFIRRNPNAHERQIRAFLQYMRGKYK